MKLLPKFAGECGLYEELSPYVLFGNEKGGPLQDAQFSDNAFVADDVTTDGRTQYQSIYMASEAGHIFAGHIYFGNTVA